MLGSLQRHLLRRLSEGVFVAVTSVYIVCFLVGWMEELEGAETIGSVLSKAHASSWRTLTSVAGLCVSIGAGLSLSVFAQERGGVSTALSGRSFVRVILPGALALSALVGSWRWAGPKPEETHAVVHWGEAEWGWITEGSDSSIDWLWIREEGRELSLSQGPEEQGGVIPPLLAVYLLGEARGSLPAWVRDATLLFIALLTLAMRLDHRPGVTLVGAVPIVLVAHWGPVILTPLVLAMTKASALYAEGITLAFVGFGLLMASRFSAAWSLRPGRFFHMLRSPTPGTSR